MTTIATDGKTIASDSCISGDYKTKGQKLFKVKDSVIGICGNYSQGLLFVEWYKDKRKEKPALTDEGFEAIVVSKDKVEIWDCNLIPMEFDEKKTAIGSGGRLAIAAMDAGKSPVEAVRIACKRDDFSSLPIRKMKIG